MLTDYYMFYKAWQESISGTGGAGSMTWVMNSVVEFLVSLSFGDDGGI